MPYKSRKNRRPVSPTRASFTGSASHAEKIDTPARINQPVKNNNISGTGPKDAAVLIPAQIQFLTEMKWIGIVAIIVVILMVASYYIFR